METVAVIFGGRSAEHDVSIVTGIGGVIKPLLLTKKYRVEAIYIAKDGSWHWDDALKDIKLFTTGRIEDFLKKDTPASITFDGGMTLEKNAGIGRKKQCKVDLVFPAMHGTYGEDGALMGLLDMAGIPYVGCGTSASAVAMDKVLCKQVTAQNGIPVTPFIVTTKTDVDTHPDTVVQQAQKLHFPLFVKPAHLGSSIGISRVQTETELKNALEVAAHYDDKIIVEEAVHNLIEVTLPIMGNDTPVPALLEQPLTKAEDFFDFNTKYMQGGKKGKGGAKQGAQGYSTIPADLPKDLYAKAQQVGLDVYKALGCSGTARIDMLIDSKTQNVYFNEVNPMPGDVYAHNWRAAGVPTIELMEKLIAYARERQTQRANLTLTFDTNYLKQF